MTDRDRNNPLEVYTVTTGVTISLDTTPVHTEDVGTVSLKYTLSAKDTLCKFRTQFVADVYNHYRAVSRNHYYAGEVGNRWQAVILVEHAVADPC